MQTMPITHLARSPVGTEAVYFLADVDGMSASDVAAKFSSGVKANFTKTGKTCEIKASRLMYGLSLGDTLESRPALLVTVVDDRSARRSHER